GNTSLASMLSGGDYDGDKVWVCWDQRLVMPFNNTPPPPDGDLLNKYFDVDKTPVRALVNSAASSGQSFMSAIMYNNLDRMFNNQSVLGKVNNLHGAYTYVKQDITTNTAIVLAQLCGFLVDALKQGL